MEEQKEVVVGGNQKKNTFGIQIGKRQKGASTFAPVTSVEACLTVGRIGFGLGFDSGKRQWIKVPALDVVRPVQVRLPKILLIRSSGE